MKSLDDVLFGTDPEFFVMEGNDIGVGIGLVGGKKGKPRSLVNGGVQEDNVLLELNIKPASTKEEFIKSITTLRSEVELLIHPRKLSNRPYHFFDEKLLKKHGAAAMEFGCDPAVNLWNQQSVSPRPTSDGLRTASGDFHVGWDSPDMEQREHVVAALEVFLGIPSVLIDPDATRRQLYGQSGNYRIKPYGIEYKVLSNQWLITEHRMSWLYDNAVIAMNSAPQIGDYISAAGGAENIQHIINTCDKNAAETLCADLNIAVPN